MAKNKSRSRKSIRQEAARIAAEDARLEALLAGESAKSSQACAAVNGTEAIALDLLARAGWRIESIEGGHGLVYQVMVSAPDACEQVIEARTAAAFVKAVRQLGTPDLYPAIVEYDVITLAPIESYDVDDGPAPSISKTVECCKCGMVYSPNPDRVKEWAESGRDYDPTDWECPKCADLLPEDEADDLLATLGTDPSRSQVEMISVVAFASKPTLVNGSDDNGMEAVAEHFDRAAFSVEAARYFEAHATVIELPSPTLYDALAEPTPFAQPTVELFDDGRPTVAQEVARRAEFDARHTRACPVEDLVIDLPVDPISGAYVAPTGKVIQLSNTRMGRSHEQKTIGKNAAANWIKHGWFGCLVTPMTAAC